MLLSKVHNILKPIKSLLPDCPSAAHHSVTKCLCLVSFPQLTAAIILNVVKSSALE